MEAGDCQERSVRFNHEHQGVRKVAKEGAMNVLVDNRKLTGIGAHALDESGNRQSKISA